MKNNFFFLYLTVLFLLGCSKQNRTIYNLAGNNLNASVKSVKIEAFEAVNKFGEITKGNKKYNILNYLLEFNENGNLKYRTYYDEEDNIGSKSVFIENEQQQIISQQDYDSDGKLISKDLITYNEDNLITKIKNYTPDGSLYGTTIYKYSKGNVIEECGETQIRDKYIKKYNYDKESLVSVIWYDKNGKELFRLLYECNNEGKPIKIKNGNKVVNIKYDKYGNITFIQNAYSTFDGDFMYVSEDEEITLEYEYEYDSHDNWIKSIVYDAESKTATVIVTREIQYY